MKKLVPIKCSAPRVSLRSPLLIKGRELFDSVGINSDRFLIPGDTGKRSHRGKRRVPRAPAKAKAEGTNDAIGWVRWAKDTTTRAGFPRFRSVFPKASMMRLITNLRLNNECLGSRTSWSPPLWKSRPRLATGDNGVFLASEKMYLSSGTYPSIALEFLFRPDRILSSPV